MALIGKIRNNFWFVLLVLGLALAAFVIMDMVNAGNRGGLGAKQIIGEVAGEEIDYMDFQRAEQALYSGNTDVFGRRDNLWNYFIEKSIIESQAEKLGLNVSSEEMNDLQFGANLSPVVSNFMRDSRTGQVDRQQLLSIKQAIDNGDPLNPNFIMTWGELMKQVRKTALQDKMNALVSKSIYTPSFVAEAVGKKSSDKVTFDYVKIPFDEVDDSEVEVSDSDIQSYIQDNAYMYTNDSETRKLRYVVIDVLPTSEDSAQWRSDLSGRIGEFRITENDSLFTINNDGFYSPFYADLDELSENIQEALPNMNSGEVYGPYLDNGAYFGVKLIDKKIIPDSVEARHILRSVANADPTQLAAANAYIDSLETLIKNGTESFEDLAKANSQDPGSASKGGDLGAFVQGTMVKPFNDAVFIDSEEGGLYTVETQFGVHLIQVNRKVFENNDPKYKLAYIRQVITPTEETQNRLYEKADDLVSENRTLSDLESAIDADPELSMLTSEPVSENDYQIGNLGSADASREMIRWAFESDTEIGDVSPAIYTYTDQVNYYNNKYVLAALASVYPKGLATVDAIKDQIIGMVRNQKKADVIIGKITDNNLTSVASQFNVDMATASDVSFTSSAVTGLGNEPEVLAKAFTLDEGSTSKPLKGNNGVYMIRTVQKSLGTSVANIPNQRRTLNNTNRGRVNFALMNALKEQFDTEDNRYKFF